jgi:hypothetical protein
VKNLVNLTPHEVVIEVGAQVLVLGVSGVVARIKDDTIPDGSISTDLGDIEVVRSRQGEVIDLPPPTSGVIYVVSRLVAERCSDRSDLVYPAGTRRSEAGQVVACRWLGRPDHNPEPAPAGCPRNTLTGAH